jgi:hypothetical protein
MNQQLTIYVNQLLDLTLNLVHIKSQLCKKAKNKIRFLSRNLLLFVTDSYEHITKCDNNTNC